MIGLQWNFGASTPELVVGLRRTVTETDNQVFGAKADFAFLLGAVPNFAPTIRLLGIGGDREVQGEAGIGVRTFDGKLLFGAGAQVPYVEGGANYVFGVGLQPYLGANTLASPPVAGGGTACPAGYSEVAATPSNHYFASVITNGMTCRRAR